MTGDANVEKGRRPPCHRGRNCCASGEGGKTKKCLSSMKCSSVPRDGSDSSSGGNLALGLVAYINAEGLDTPMPGYIMAISPGTCVASDEEWQRMLELDKVDVAIPAQYMKDAEIVMRCGDDNVPDYMLRLQNGDFTNCPRVTFLYGSDETLYACAPSFERAMQKYGVDYQMIVGKGMFHCYPVFPIVPEAKEGWRQMVDLMKGEGKTVERIAAR